MSLFLKLHALHTRTTLRGSSWMDVDVCKYVSLGQYIVNCEAFYCNFLILQYDFCSVCYLLIRTFIRRNVRNM